MVFNSKHYTKHCHCNQYRAYDTVDQPKRTDIESRTQFADKQCDDIPPNERSRKNHQISPYIMEYLIFGQNEVKPRKQADYKEQYQWIGNCEEKARNEVAPIALTVGSRGFERAGRIFAEQIKAESREHNAAEHLQGKLMALDDISNETETETGKQAIKQIAQRRTDSRKECRPATLAQSALNHEHTYRPHRR